MVLPPRETFGKKLFTRGPEYQELNKNYKAKKMQCDYQTTADSYRQMQT